MAEIILTTLSEVYEAFESKISDYNLLTITPEEIDEQLFDYFKSARAKFYKCKNSLETFEDLATGEVTFKSQLHPFEIEVIVSLMLVEYMKPQILSSKTMEQSLSDKDFKIYSQANQLRELRLLYDVLKKEAKKMVKEYTYIDLSEDDFK
jgi:hypothetical protein